MERKAEYGITYPRTDDLFFHVPAKYGIEDNRYTCGP